MRKIKTISMFLALMLSAGFLTACDMYNCTHDWGEWEEMSNPTCTQAGEEKRICLINNAHIQTRLIDPIGHDWGDWILTTPPSGTELGIETRICKHDNSHIQTRIEGNEEPNEQPVGKNEQVQRNEHGYIVTKSGLWLGEHGVEYTVLAYSGESKTVEIPAFVNNKPITAIGDGAYFHPDVVGYVPPVWSKYMFPNNKNITSVTFEEGSRIRQIGWVSFNGCTSLVNFETPDSLRSIGEGAFLNTGIWNETADNSVVYAGNWAVGYKGNEKNDVAIKSGTVGISSCAFMGTSFKNIIIPQSVKIVCEWAFYESQLFNSAPNNSVVYADQWVVEHKGNLGAVTLRQGTVGIADSALRYGDSLTSIVIPSSVESIGEDAFLLCDSLTTVTIKNGLKSIGNAAFLYCSALQSINIPQSVTNIGTSAFGSCRSLTTVSLPQDMTTISGGLFFECNSLESFTISSSVKIIGDSAFWGTAIKNIVIPEGVVSIGKNAFVENTQMKSLTVETGNKFYRSEGNCLIEIATDKLLAGFKNAVIPNGIKFIEENAFKGINITYISIPDSVLTIGDYAFYGCTNLKSVNFGSGLTEIGDYVFSYSGLKNLELPPNITKIGTFAFRECPIENLVIPDSLTYLGLGAFYNTSITSLVIGNGDIKIDGWGAFAYCEDLTSVIIPASMKTIGQLMFWNCTSLTDVTIENGVTTIKDGAFTGCVSLTSIIIPSSVITIEPHAFYACSKLTIYVEAKEKPSGWDEEWNIGKRPVVWEYKG